jgi:hypothetical protein
MKGSDAGSGSRECSFLEVDERWQRRHTCQRSEVGGRDRGDLPYRCQDEKLRLQTLASWHLQDLTSSRKWLLDLLSQFQPEVQLSWVSPQALMSWWNADDLLEEER